MISGHDDICSDWPETILSTYDSVWFSTLLMITHAILRAATCERGSYVICGQCSVKTPCASMQYDQELHCPFIIQCKLIYIISSWSGHSPLWSGATLSAYVWRQLCTMSHVSIFHPMNIKCVTNTRCCAFGGRCPILALRWFPGQLGNGFNCLQ